MINNIPSHSFDFRDKLKPPLRAMVNLLMINRYHDGDDDDDDDDNNNNNNPKLCETMTKLL